MAPGAVYVPQWDPWQGLRQGILQLAMGYSRGLEKQDMTGQIAELMANLPGTREKQTLFPMAMNQTGGTPAPGEGISPSGGVDTGTPAAPAIVEQVPEPFDLKKVMGGITDPNLAMGILPTMMNYDSESKRMAAAEKLAKMKEAFEQAKLDNEPVKITAWKKAGNEYQPFTVTVKRKNVPEVEARFQEKGYYVGETPKAIPQGPHKVISYKDPITGRFVQKDTVTGQIMDYPGQGEGEKAPTQKEAANKISDIDKAIFSLETKGTLGDPIMAMLAASNPGLVDQLKGDPKEAIKTLEAEREYYLPYAPKQIQDRYDKPKTDNTPKVLSDPAKAKAYLDAAGGDKEKARKMARKDGWTF